MGSVMNSRPDPNKPGATPFVQKVYELVQDASTDDTVGWEASGRSFVIRRVGDFTEVVLPSYFKHSNMSSFVRQLNQYGFHKVSHERWEFEHEYFRRDRPELLDSIKRNRSDRSRRRGGAAAAGAGGQPASAHHANHMRMLPGSVETKSKTDAGAQYIRQHVNVPRAASEFLAQQQRQQQGGEERASSSQVDVRLSERERQPVWSGRYPSRGASTVEVGKYGSMEDEAAQLRRDNRVLMQELTELRRLYMNMEQRLCETEIHAEERDEHMRQLKAFMLRMFSSVEVLNAQLINAGLDFLALDPEWTQALPYLMDKESAEGTSGEGSSAFVSLDSFMDAYSQRASASTGTAPPPFGEGASGERPSESGSGAATDSAPSRGANAFAAGSESRLCMMDLLSSPMTGAGAHGKGAAATAPDTPVLPNVPAAEQYRLLQGQGSSDRELETLQEKMRTMYQQEQQQQRRRDVFLTWQQHEQQAAEPTSADAAGDSTTSASGAAAATRAPALDGADYLCEPEAPSRTAGSV